MTTPQKTPKECLKRIVGSFLNEITKLDKADTFTRNNNFDNAFFLNNDDVVKVQCRMEAMAALYDILKQNIEGSGKFVPTMQSGTRNCINTLPDVEKKIEALSDKDVINMLGTFESDAIKKIAENREKLQRHSLSDKWMFPFIAKLITMARSALGLKTSSELTIENAFEDCTSNKPK